MTIAKRDHSNCGVDFRAVRRNGNAVVNQECGNLLVGNIHA